MVVLTVREEEGNPASLSSVLRPWREVKDAGTPGLQVLMKGSEGRLELWGGTGGHAAQHTSSKSRWTVGLWWTGQRP